MRILIVQLARLGDGLQTGYLISRLKSLHNDAEITCLASPASAIILGRVSGVERVITVPPELLADLENGASLDAPALQQMERIKKSLNRSPFDQVFNLNRTQPALILSNLVKEPGLIRGYRLAVPKGGVKGEAWHCVVRPYMDYRRYLPINLVDLLLSYLPDVDPGQLAGINLKIGATEDSWAEKIVGSLDAAPAVVHLGAATKAKRWPVARFAEVVKSLDRLGLQAVLVGGDEDRAGAAEVTAAAAKARPIDLIGQTSIGRLAALLSRAKLFLGGDSGPIHLAAALGTPSLGLYWCYSWPPETGPYSLKTHCLCPDLDCYPCPDPSAACLDRCRDMITPQAVVRTVEAVLGDEPDAVAGEGVRVWLARRDSAGIFYHPGPDSGEPAELFEIRLAMRIVLNSLLQPGYLFQPADALVFGIEPERCTQLGPSLLDQPEHPAGQYWSALQKTGADDPEADSFLGQAEPRVRHNLEAFKDWASGQETSAPATSAHKGKK